MAKQVADRLDPCCMALEFRQAAGPGPPSVSVHDDRDVPWQILERDE
jgi:hypothetical protein